MRQAGFTFVEIMVVVAVLLLLAAVTVLSLGAFSDRLLLRSAASDVAFALEAAKARSVAGAGGEAHGVHFADDSFVEFSGESYDDEDSGNVAHELDDRLSLSTDILNGEESVIFSRITGAVGETVTIEIALAADPTKAKTVVVGPGGDISYGE